MFLLHQCSSPSLSPSLPFSLSLSLKEGNYDIGKSIITKIEDLEVLCKRDSAIFYYGGSLVDGNVNTCITCDHPQKSFSEGQILSLRVRTDTEKYLLESN